MSAETKRVVDAMFIDTKQKKFLKVRVPLEVIQGMFTQIEQYHNENKGSEFEVHAKGEKFHADEVLVDYEIDPMNTPYCRN